MVPFPVGEMSATQGHIKIKLREINRHLVCRLCRGYYVDATTIAECLHSFCRSCIIKYLEKNSFCPICEVQIHKTKPYLNLRLDKALQDVVYKVVPGLYHDEMKRRRDFYTKRQEQIPFATPEQCGLEERIIFSPEDSISLSLEYLESDDYESETVSSRSSESGDVPDVLSFPQQLGLIKLKNNEGKASRRESQDVQDMSLFPKRYLQCPAVVNIGHLKKFIKMKHDLTDKMQVNIVHKRVPLPDHYTLMDVAYIYTWKRSAPLRFFYQIYRTKKHKVSVPPLANETKKSKLETIAEDEKPVKTEVEDKCRIISAVNPSVESDKSAKSNVDKNHSPGCEVKQTMQNNVLKHMDSNKPVSEMDSVKSDVIVNSQTSVDSVKEEKKDGLKSDLDICAVPRVGKNEKSKPVNVNENKTKTVEGQKRKSEKVENNANAREVKENECNNERLLLNPISGQLESVPSSDAVKAAINGEILVEGVKDTVDCSKKETAKGQKRMDSQSTRDPKKSNVNLLKSFRKEKLSTGKEDKVEIKSSKGSSLTITAVSKNEKPPEKETAKFSVEIKAESKESEYDFDGSSPPSKIIPLQEFSKYSKYSKYMADHRDKWLSKESKSSWMSLQDFRKKMLKENNSNEMDLFKKSKKKVVPSLYKINSEKNKTTIKKIPNGKLPNDKWKGSKIPRTVINIQTETDDKKTEFRVEVLEDNKEVSPKPIKVENKDNFSDEKDKDCNKTEKAEIKFEAKKKLEHEKKLTSLVKEPLKDGSQGKAEGEGPKDKVPNVEIRKNESVGAIDLSKGETSQKSGSPLESLMDLASKAKPPKGDEKVMEALITAAQKQSIEPLLKVPQYSQAMKNTPSQGSYSPVKNISPSEISQALQFLEDLRSDIKVLESKNQLNPNSVLEQFAQKSGNFQPYQELYQQKIDLIRRLKRHQQILPGDPDSIPRKLMKLSPTSESKKKLSPTSEQKAKLSAAEEAAQYKSSIDKTLSQIQLMELENRMLVAQNYKNLPALLQYYSRPPAFCPGPTSPGKASQQKTKAPSHSPNTSKSPQSRTSPLGNAALSGANSDPSLFSSQSYLINAGLNSEMTYLQMFQSYLSQQEQMNQVKLAQMQKKPVKFSEVSAKSLSDKYYVPQTSAKKQESNNSVAPAQKT